MARRHIRKDVSGKGWKHTQALKAGASGHIRNPREASEAPAVEITPPAPEPEPEPVVEEVEIDLADEVKDEVKEEKPKKRWGRTKKTSKKATKKKSD